MRPGLEPTQHADVAHDDTVSAEPVTKTAPGRSSASSSGPGLATGQQLGHFRIERPLGAGGMGEVYLATDLALDRPVAIKVLPAQLAADAARRDRLVREARAQARVVHPNVAHIYFIGEDAGRLYFAMELVPGQTLSDRIASAPPSVEDALGLVRQAALGLREAQRNGITHRDVKPSNLMVDSHGIVKVLDFGLAAGDLGEPGAGAVEQTSLAGTPLYMAPEQARGEPVDLRTDIYALGATLYHLISGKPPFVAESADELRTLHSGAERPTVRRRGVARTQIGAIDALIAKMMAPRPEDRYASYDELLRAIDLASTTHTRPAGVFVRAIATAVDFIVLAIATVLVMVAYDAVTDADAGNRSIGPILMPLYALYAALATGRFGRTLGQSLFELEVVDVTSQQRPGWSRATVRAVAVAALPTLGVGISQVAGLFGYELYGLANLAIVLLTLANGGLLLWAAARAAGKRTVWDRVSHTMVRYAHRRA